MPINPLAPVTDYQSMLNRIFWFTSAAALAAIWMLRRHLPGVDALLAQIDFTMAFAGSKALPIPGGYLAPALALGLAARVYRLHARVSDVLGIREVFDLNVIVREFADQLDVDLTLIDEKKLRTSRHAVMRKAFYPFVSSSQPQIDPQLVHQALDAWSWFWIGVEAVTLFTVTGGALVACGVHRVGFFTIACALFAAVIALPPIREQCRRYAVAQVRALLDDPSRAAVAQAALQELVGGSTALRFAA